MKLRHIGLATILLVVLSEAALTVWQRWPVEASDAPVFRWDGPPDGAQVRNVPDWTMKVYRADRGRESEFESSGGRRVAVAYFEFDRVELGPIMDLNRHAPEFCNATAGFKFLGPGEPRVFESEGGLPIEFDVTRFLSPSGEEVHVFKSTWLQGVGSWNLRPGRDRLGRLRGSLIRSIGEARVLQGGVFGPGGEEEAWNIFKDSILNQLSWK